MTDPTQHDDHAPETDEAEDELLSILDYYAALAAQHPGRCVYHSDDEP